ncbi:MAG: hypothetical protein HY692_05870 [Cyanobacteria bacterium NC_groundwater_1444_Ag_S-0.65um_54_12]|nr:hypothetical protein [Cyanobacteria bacterium NC_groundwater_1444_Ag_S-0.65um_54_12]
MASLTSNQPVVYGLTVFLAFTPHSAWSKEASRSVPVAPIDAAMYSLLLPGAGQLSAGEWSRGIFFVSITIGLSGMAVLGYLQKNEFLLSVGGTGILMVSVVAPIDAFFVAQRRFFSGDESQ